MNKLFGQDWFKASIAVIVGLSAIYYFAIYLPQQQRQNNLAAQQVASQSNNANQQPATSAILDKATPPNYNGSDLVRLRQECAAQTQEGFNKFVQGQEQVATQYNLLPLGSYSLGQYHFNEKLGACLIEINDSFNTPTNALNVKPNSPADTTYLVNIYENSSVMNCTSYGDPVTSRICYDDQGSGSGFGNLISYDDWESILNQYMSQ